MRHSILVGVLALALLMLLRRLTGASRTLTATCAVAFVLWMATSQVGFLSLNGFGLPNGIGIAGRDRLCQRHHAARERGRDQVTNVRDCVREPQILTNSEASTGSAYVAQR
jgi:putative intracellular protease/amidase